MRTPGVWSVQGAGAGGHISPLARTVTLSALFLLGVTLIDCLRDQSVGVRGTLKCGNQPLSNTVVKLWDVDAGPDPDDLLDEGFTDSNGTFELSGHSSELTGLDPVLKVYHKCNDEKKACKRKVRFSIPKNFVSNGKTVKKWYSFGEMNMEATFEDEDRSCVT